MFFFFWVGLLVILLSAATKSDIITQKAFVFCSQFWRLYSALESLLLGLWQAARWGQLLYFIHPMGHSSLRDATSPLSEIIRHLPFFAYGWNPMRFPSSDLCMSIYMAMVRILVMQLFLWYKQTSWYLAVRIFLLLLPPCSWALDTGAVM